MKTLKEYGLSVKIPKSARAGLGVGQGSGYKNILNDDSYKHYLAGKGVTIYQPFFKGTKMEHSPLELTLYVPSTQGENRVVRKPEQKKRLVDAEQKMSRIFGGITEVDATGRWYNGKGRFVREPIGKVTSYTTPEAFEKGRADFEKYVRQIGRKYGQTSLAMEFEGDMFFYPVKKEEVR
jgi:hypothetical protein